MTQLQTKYQRTELPFRPRARLLLLLGDQLIRSPGIAAFELVKNAYDADATKVTMLMSLRSVDANGASDGVITVQDNGSGMTWNTVTGVWLEPGAGHREEERLRGKRTPRFGRLPMGEKGVGRFAAHKLGRHITLVTRAEGCPEVVVDINWDRFARNDRYLDQIRNTVHEREPEVFTGDRTGTRITITGLRQVWNRGMVRELARAISSIQSPFRTDDSFRARLRILGHRDWLAGLLKPADVLALALYEVHGTITGDQFTYTYEFKPARDLRVPPRTVKRTVGIARPAVNRKPDPRPLDLTEHEIGPVELDVYIYDFDPGVLRLSGITDKKGLKEYLAQNGGVRVYRDNVRVFDYAEPGNDWLDLEGRRINRPGLRLSNNLVLGAISLRREASGDLVEKTNREGFVENEAYRDLVNAVQAAIVHIEEDRRQDKDDLRQASTAPGAGVLRAEPVLTEIAELRALAIRRGLLREIDPILIRLEKNYIDVRDLLLTSATAGLSLTVMVHEIEKQLTGLRHAIAADVDASPRVREIAGRLAGLVDGLGALARKSGSARESAAHMLQQAAFTSELRMVAHRIRLEVPSPRRDFTFEGTRHLVLATLTNLIDNSIWWLDHHPPAEKKIVMFISDDLPQGPALVVADNNALGFIDPAEDLVKPFHTRKPGGMGLGLHLSSEVMKVHNGELRFVDAGDIGLPAEYKAVVTLIFPEARWSA